MCNAWMLLMGHGGFAGALRARRGEEENRPVMLRERNPLAIEVCAALRAHAVPISLFLATAFAAIVLAVR